MSRPQLEKLMKTPAINVHSLRKNGISEAAQYRDELYRLEQRLKEL